VAVAEPLRLALVAAEATPFAKTGGLGDAVAGLARTLAGAGHEVRLFLPLYSSIDTRGRGFAPVEFARGVPLRLGERTLAFSLATAPLPGGRLWAHFVHCPPLYDRPGIYTGGADDALRFTFLVRATLESCQRMGFAPQVFHVHDWHAALLPVLLRSAYSWDGLFAASRVLLTLHNVGYQGVVASDLLPELGLERDWLPAGDLAAGRLNFLKAGILHADLLSTVSPTHAREIQTPEYGAGLDGLLRQRSASLVGILNGVDEEWDPVSDALIPFRYAAGNLEGKALDKQALCERLGLPHRPGTPLAGVVTRLTPQKGIDLMMEVLPPFLAERDLQLAALGSGEARYEEFFSRLARAFPGKTAYHRGYDNELAHLIEAGADLFLMPSRYEPCGLNQMYSLRYGTPPVVRKTGGLADSVEPWDWVTRRGTGFVFEHPTAAGFAWALDAALETYRHPDSWRELQRNGMARDFSWSRQGALYVDLYRRLLA
jgi:starch synthase